MEAVDHTEQSGKITWRTLVASGALLTIGIAAFLLINSAGTRLKAPAPAPNQELFVQGVTLAQFETLLHLLLALAVILIAARGAGLLFRRIGQPPVIGEVIAGILLGPSLLATALPEVHAYLLPASISPLIGVIAQVGVVLYMFLVGLEVNPAVIRSNSSAVLTISQTSIIVPFISGAALALLLYPVFSTNDVPFPVFLLFMGISMSVTAFPVLVRILTDNGMQRSRLGVIATTCAALNDVTAWCMLAFVVGVAKASFEDAVQTLVLTGLYLIFMIVVVRRLMLHIVRRAEAKPEIGQTTVGIMLLLLLMSSFATEWIGIHGLFGAFLLGAIVPPDCKLARGLRQRFHDLVVVLFLPAYFAFTGMRTEVGLITGADQWLFLGIIILVASLGKFGASLLAARFSGMQWREGAAIGVLMNTRGLMELIVLNIGYELNVLSPTLITMMVLMAVVTTLATTPILQLIVGDKRFAEKGAPDAKVSQVKRRHVGPRPLVQQVGGASEQMGRQEAGRKVGRHEDVMENQ